MTTPDDCPLIGKDEALMRETLVEAAREILGDAELMRRFWHSGYVELSTHARAGSAQWIGAKILALLGSALLGIGAYLVVRFGLSK